MSLKPVRLSDSELDAIFSAAGPLPVEARDTFLRAVAHRLQQECGEIGPGTVGRICRELQRQFFDPPEFEGPGAVSRWSRADGGLRKHVEAG